MLCDSIASTRFFFPLWLGGYKGGGLISGDGEMSRIGVHDVKFTKRIKRFNFF